MSLRAFHLFFMAASVTLAAFVAAWATGEYRAGHGASYAAASAACMLSAIGLAAYANAFRRKTKDL
jgi:hypothetical protein